MINAKNVSKFQKIQDFKLHFGYSSIIMIKMVVKNYTILMKHKVKLKILVNNKRKKIINYTRMRSAKVYCVHYNQLYLIECRKATTSEYSNSFSKRILALYDTGRFKVHHQNFKYSNLFTPTIRILYRIKFVTFILHTVRVRCL